ncbi:hypothetical protein DVH05_015789 [Phytophthora capsici]|nr:hypothetical protein DVH05_015789 [Phytophthora capsici]
MTMPKPYFPQDVSPPPTKKRQVVKMTSGDGGSNLDSVTKVNGSDLETVMYTHTDSQYHPRKRISKRLEEMDTMLNDSDEIKNTVPPFKPASTLETWSSFEDHFAKYKKKYNLKFRN